MPWLRDSRLRPRGGRRALLTSAWLLAIVGPAQAQGFGPDPFRPYNSQFVPFVYPVAPGPFDAGQNQGLPGVNGIRGANQFNRYLDELQGIGRRAPGRFQPYYQANRIYDQEFGRSYRPNREADAQFETDQQRITNLYFRYLREKDPKKRAELFRQYNEARGQMGRELAGSSRSARRGGTTAAREEAPPPTRGPGGRASARARRTAPPPNPAPPRTSPTTPGPGAFPTAPPPLDDDDATDRRPPPTPAEVLDRATRDTGETGLEPPLP
jgi:hypothetical protein